MVILTDGGLNLKENNGDKPEKAVPKTFKFPAKLHLVVVSNENGATVDISPWDDLLESHKGTVHNIKSSTFSDTIAEIGRFTIDNLQLPAVKIQLGCIKSFASVYPPSSIFSGHNLTLEIGGFLPTSGGIYNAEATSR